MTRVAAKRRVTDAMFDMMDIQSSKIYLMRVSDLRYPQIPDGEQVRHLYSALQLAIRSLYKGFYSHTPTELTLKMRSGERVMRRGMSRNDM